MSRFTLALLAAAPLAGVVYAVPAPAQGPLSYEEGQQAIHFLDRSYVSLGNLGIDSLIAEAQLAAQLYFAGNLFAKSKLLDSREGKWTRAWSFSFSPMVRLRGFRERSSPVRTPSFIPYLSGQWFWLKRAGAFDAESTLWKRPVDMRTLQVRIVHHSNGQSGCLFSDEVKNARGDCVAAAGQAGPRTTNTENGSFSTHYLQAGAFLKRMRLDEQFTVARSLSGGVIVELHQVFAGLPGGMPKDVRTLYGATRIKATTEGIWRTRRWGAGKVRAEAWAEYLPHDGDVPDARYSVEAVRTWERLGGWGVYARYYAGQDYYNLYFLTNRRMLQLGISYDAERFDYFGAPSH